MTKRQARRFIAGAADDVCVSYAYDDDGSIVFRHPVSAAFRGRRDDVRRLVTVAATVPLVAVAACNRAPPAHRESVTVAVPSASAAQCDDLIRSKTDEVTKLQNALDMARNDKERERIENDLIQAREQLADLKGPPGPPEPNHRLAAGKMTKNR
jgi:hypothetical protein